MALEPRERAAWDRVVRAARAAMPHLGNTVKARTLGPALDSGEDVLLEDNITDA